jgi:hypothetical protein
MSPRRGRVAFGDQTIAEWIRTLPAYMNAPKRTVTRSPTPSRRDCGSQPTWMRTTSLTSGFESVSWPPWGPFGTGGVGGQRRRIAAW